MPDAHREDIAKLESLYAQHPEGRIFTHLAEAYRKAGELERAAEVLGTGLERHPDYSSAHVVLGRVLVDQGRPREAEAEFRRVLELDPHNLVALRALGDLARADGRRDAALEHYHRLLEMEPADGHVRAAVDQLSEAAFADADLTWAGGGEGGGTEEEAGRDDEEVRPAFQEPVWAVPPADDPAAASARDARPDDDGDLPSMLPGVMTETIAQVYARQGLYDRAAEVYRELLRGRPGDSRLREQLEEMERHAAPAADPEPGDRPTPAERAESTEWTTPFEWEAPVEEESSRAEDTETTERADWLESVEPEPAAAESGTEAAQESETGSVWVSGEWGGEAEEGDPTPYAWAEPEPEPEPDESAPIRSYLQSLLSWAPGHPPAASGAGEEGRGEEGVGDIDGGGEEAHGDEGEQEDSDVERPTGAEPASAERADAGEPADDDDDLDTFRSWLEHLKQ
jgi:tetratricopeptide (TPR) repeat protein